MLDPSRLEEFIDQIRLTPAIWRHVDYGIEKAHMDEIWNHFGHTFDISAKEAEDQWKYLIRLHRFMNSGKEEKHFRIHVANEKEDEWSDADAFVADSLEMFLKSQLDQLLLIQEPTESEV